jgi:hypothetical protein
VIYGPFRSQIEPIGLLIMGKARVDDRSHLFRAVAVAVAAVAVGSARDRLAIGDHVASACATDARRAVERDMITEGPARG